MEARTVGADGMKYWEVVNSGAGTLGGLEVGAQAAFWDAGNRPDFITSTSAGAIIGGLLALGKTPAEMRLIMLDADYEKLINYNPISPFRTSSLAGSANVQAWLREITDGQTMADTQIPLVTCSGDLSLQTAHYWRSWKVPDMPVADAIYASMAIPFIFPPYEGRFCDGGTVSNLSISELPGKSPAIALHVTEFTKPGVPTGLIDTVEAVVGLMLDANVTQAVALAKAKRVPVVSLPGGSVGFLDRGMTRSEKERLYQIGYETMQAYLEETT